MPAFVTDVRDPMHPYTYAQPVDMKRNNNTTAYTHSVDVDQDGIAWTSGFGGIRGFYTHGLRHDPVLNGRPLRDRDRPGPVRGRQRPVARDPGAVRAGQPRAQLVPRHQAASDKSPPTVTTASGRTIRKTDLQYVTQENVANCTSTSGGGSGRFVIANLAGSYDGKAWDPNLVASDPTKRYFIEKLDDYTPRDLPGSANGSSCSAHWFTVVGDMVAIAFYGNGTRILDVSDPTDIKQAGYFRHPGRGAAQPRPTTRRRPTGTTATSTSPTTAAASTSCATRARSRASSSRRCAGTPATTRRRRRRCATSSPTARRRTGAGDAGADARHAGDVRRVHAGHRATTTTPRRRRT